MDKYIMRDPNDINSVEYYRALGGSSAVYQLGVALTRHRRVEDLTILWDKEVNPNVRVKKDKN